MDDTTSVTVTINGEEYEETVEPRTLLVDFIRHEVGLTGTHRGCSSGRCGACTVLVDGETMKSCMMFAPQVDGATVTTIEGVESEDGDLHPIQEEFAEGFAIQCGFCTPGMVLSTSKLLSENPDPTDEEIREGISGNLCRCTGYDEIIDSIETLAETGNPEEMSVTKSSTTE